MLSLASNSFLWSSLISHPLPCHFRFLQLTSVHTRVHALTPQWEYLLFAPRLAENPLPSGQTRGNINATIPTCATPFTVFHAIGAQGVTA